ncbi:MAG: DUF916 domain-containing protein [Candidatus Nealsonbacteria bacterium]|nr:DUF916 domain-containing protein [Candidatus Nealsonbacteria bacterium]
MLKNKNYLFILAIIIIVFCIPCSSMAITAEGVGVSPAYPDLKIKNSDVWFVYNLDRGQSVTDYLKLVNNSSEKTMKVKIYPVDAVISSSGVFNPLDEADPRVDIGAWIKFNESEVSLAPGETRIMPFTLTIPQDASVGDHLGAVIAEKGELKPSGQAGLSIKTRVGIRVWNTVPGKIVKDLKISNISWEIKNKTLSSKPTTIEKIKTALGLNKEGFITLELKNDGNVHLMPKGNIEISDVFGGWVATLGDLSLGTSSLGHTTTVPIRWDKIPLIGLLTAKITIPYGDNQTATAKKTFLIIPWTLIAILILFAMIFIFGKLFRWLYFAKSKLKMSPYKLAGKETLVEIADKFDVSWKKLARINGLKPPYILKKGDTLFIPKKGNKNIRNFAEIISSPLKKLRKLIKR